MITIFPMEDKTAFASATDRLSVTADVILEAKDGEELLGRIGFILGQGTLHITGISVTEPFIVDGLIKAVMSYAMQRELPVVTAEVENFESQFLAIGFVKKDAMLFLRLDTFTSNCQH